jgi:AI2M/AI1M-like, HNH endonuclease
MRLPGCPGRARRSCSSVSKMAARYKAKVQTPYGLRTRFEASIERDGRKALVAWFGGIPLKRQKYAVLTDRIHAGPVYPNRQLVTRLLQGRCELCQQTDNIQVHHVRALADLRRPGQPQPEWAHVMTRIRRKSSWSAAPATTASTGTPPHRSRSSHWRAGYPETGPSGSREAERKRTATR